MHFCSSCDNMYYIRIDSEESNKLIYYCRNCGNEDDTITIENVVVTDTSNTNNKSNLSHVINQYTKLDPTLPRFNTILCPNPECTTNTHTTEREIIYIRYDETNIKYVYLCSTCDTVWKP
jgi:DNA-directed RNA polymerase subunit M/transcription elongation factor TFIIS